MSAVAKTRNLLSSMQILEIARLRPTQMRRKMTTPPALKGHGFSRAKTRSQKNGLQRLCRNWCRRYAARLNFPLDPGLAPRAHVNAAASRLGWLVFTHFVPLSNFTPGCDTVSSAPEGTRVCDKSEIPQRLKPYPLLTA